MPKEPMLSKIVYVQQDIHVLKKKVSQAYDYFQYMVWCVGFSNHGWLSHAWSTTVYYSKLLSTHITFKGCCRTLGIYFNS